MFRSRNAKKTFVLTLACLSLLVYLLGIVAIAQTADRTENVVLTPDAMAQVVGGACQRCTYDSGGWYPHCAAYLSCFEDEQRGCTGDAYFYMPDPNCASTSMKKVCWYSWVDSWYYKTYECYCAEPDSIVCSTGSVTGTYGSQQKCDDKSSNSC